MKLYDRGTGTCFNPPLSTTAEKALEFWEQVEIPDITIERAKNLYNEQQRVDFAGHLRSVVTEHMQQWETKKPYPKFVQSRQNDWARNRAEEEADFTADISEAESEIFFNEENPERMKTTEAQQITRAWFAYRNGPNPELFPGELEKLCEHEVELFRGSETIVTLLDRYRLTRFAAQLNKVPDPTSDAIHQMQDALAGILYGLSDNTRRTADVVQEQLSMQQSNQY